MSGTPSPWRATLIQIALLALAVIAIVLLKP